MNPYSVPSFISFTLLIFFGLAIILQNPHDKTGRLLSLLCLILGLTSGAVGMLHLSTTEADANLWNKWPYLISFLSFPAMMA